MCCPCKVPGGPCKKFPNVSFLRIVSTECIENFPDKNLPADYVSQRRNATADSWSRSIWWHSNDTGSFGMAPKSLQCFGDRATRKSNDKKGSPTLRTNLTQNYVDRSGGRNKRSPHSPNRTQSFTRHVKGGMLLDGNQESGDESDDY